LQFHKYYFNAETSVSPFFGILPEFSTIQNFWGALAPQFLQRWL